MGRERNPDGDATADQPSRPSCDYLLVVGPGRSGSTFLYRLVNRHAAFSAPRIKEGYYYRSPRRFEKALREAREDTASILLDVANRAWRDPALPDGVKTLVERGHRVLLVVLLRNHLDRFVSIAQYRRSRGGPLALRSQRALERDIVRKSLTPEDLSRIFGLGTDVLVVGFEAMINNTADVLGHLARLCGTADFEDSDLGPANPSVQARSMLLAAMGKFTATTLRATGCHRLLQWLKDNPYMTRLFFRPASGDRPAFDQGIQDLLASHSATCWRAVENRGERLAEDLWLVRTGIDALAGRE